MPSTTNQTRRVVIVGGGTAGWLTAARLNKTFNEKGQVLDITLVESATTLRIGVGEATVPTLRRTMQLLGVDEAEFVRRSSATFKQAIRFEDWAELGSHYYHPFEAFRESNTSSGAVNWLSRRGQDSDDFASAAGIQAALCDGNRSPRRAQDRGYQGPMNYAYHLDADLLGDFLCELACAAGVKRVVDHVENIEVSPEGLIEAVTTRSGNRLEGDLFIDCSGFASLLMGRLEVPFESYGQYLLCDRATAFRTPNGPAAVLRPYTRSRALSAGWSWGIGLQNREGHGYVWSSQFTDAEAAERELRATVPEAEGVEARQLKMRVGRSEVSWKGNCIGIGLSSGFIEPLESTGIFLIEEAVDCLIRYFPVGGLNAADIAAYNVHFKTLYEEIRDFVVAHYCVSRRTDSAFWREVVKPERIPDSLKARLDAWSRRVPGMQELGGAGLFALDSYFYVLFGMGWTPPDAVRWAGLTEHGRSDLRPMLTQARARALADLPDHTAFIRQQYG